jgi:NTP pyrophosphatase (non-canonical NTP hydrolase)
VKIDAEKLVALQRAFVAERAWEKFHTPKNLAAALSVEASELLELFQWRAEETPATVAGNAELMEKVREELADVLYYTLRLADLLDVDLQAASEAKMGKNATKYPADRVRGSMKKYSDY